MASGLIQPCRQDVNALAVSLPARGHPGRVPIDSGRMSEARIVHGPSLLARGRPCSPLRMASTPVATPASGSGQRGGVANLLQVELAVPKQRLAQREPL